MRLYSSFSSPSEFGYRIAHTLVKLERPTNRRQVAADNGQVGRSTHPNCIVPVKNHTSAQNG
ncbi:MAG: hypothetical protein H0X66_08810 [Verrucomicrobia bacterium]|nr:hypothetical protein [Verrucomicrobiota bacterium]